MFAHTTILPAYYDYTLTLRAARDNQSGEMLELIYNTRAFDFAYVYDNFGLSFTFQYQVERDNPDLASYYQKNEKVSKKMIEKNIKAYGEG